MDLRMRPRFTLAVRIPPDEVLARFREAQAARRLPCRVCILDGFAEFSPRAQEHRVWSPYLKLVAWPDADTGGTRLDGRFGPNGSLWTFFMAIYAGLLVIGSVAILWAWTQWMLLDQTPIALAVVAACIAGAGVVYGAGRLGQHLADDQMRALHDAVVAELADVR